MRTSVFVTPSWAGAKRRSVKGQHATELKPEAKDATDGVLMSCYLALIYARLGEKDLAFPLIERLLKRRARLIAFATASRSTI